MESSSTASLAFRESGRMTLVNPSARSALKVGLEIKILVAVATNANGNHFVID